MTGNYVGQILETGSGGIGSSTINAISADGTKATGLSRFDNTAKGTCGKFAPQVNVVP